LSFVIVDECGTLRVLALSICNSVFLQEKSDENFLAVTTLLGEQSCER